MKINGPKFTELIKTKWNDMHSNTSVFRYKIDNIQERIVDKKYLLQLNPNRITKRRTPEQIVDICQQFDKNKFNFTKISNEEILFEFKADNNDDTHIFVVNVSPISRYHTLLCPSLDKCLPQVVTKHSLEMVIDLLLLAEDCDLRIAFNSLCALASVNHLHYHLFIEKHTLPIETVKCKHVKGPLYCFENYPAPAFCFEITKKSPKIDEIFKLIEFFLDKSIAHNIFVTRGDPVEENLENDEMSYRFVIWPRKSCVGVKQLLAFNVAACELSGWFVVHSNEEFYTLQTEQLEKELRKWGVENFEELCEQVKLLY
ncbi:GDP-D-glucose phosphorylase 1 [Maniola hyperantus]|uniref:GDP-D-glucose phosphorylase 1 n=1 Tax=Aphantopus hyperantus TaxID=2795564 RepID=UPI0015687818|nr:GDP-D-glucose phosphorylase 1 isoform X1 [Maniola hyperantus]XP_034836497.1 GDP-D-glucose phosphorylase 1 isoform X1 [Maniola hyperantus]